MIMIFDMFGTVTLLGMSDARLTSNLGVAYHIMKFKC